MAEPKGQLLHLVFGGELSDLDSNEFRDLSKVEVVGIYPNYATAYNAWKAKAQRSSSGNAAKLCIAVPSRPCEIT